MELTPNLYEQAGGVKEYIRKQRMKRTGVQLTRFQELERYEMMDEERNPKQKKLTDFFRR